MLNIEYSISEFTTIIDGQLIEGTTKQSKISDILIDSRRLIAVRQCIFFALVTKRNNGHKYIEELYKRGIRHFVVSGIPENKSKFSKANFIVVDNTLKALQRLATGHRRKFEIPVIGITGSNGKTIVKEWLYQLLSEDKNVIRSPKSYNSQIGVPLSIWQINSKHELGIFEAGISEPNEMDKLQTIIQPNIGVFTNVGHAHDENFINLQQKAGEKLKLFTKVDTLIYCADHPEIQGIVIRSGILENVKPFTWSSKIEEADLFISKINKNSNGTILIGKYQNIEKEILIPFTDNASIENAIHCWATMLHLKISMETVAERMPVLNQIAMRLELKEGINNCSIINDSYNSDINSIRIALDFLSQQKQHKKKTLILSDVLQSGRNEINLYSNINELLEGSGVQKIIGIGQSISEQAERFSIEKYFYPSTDDFLNKHSFAGFNGESILLKGARIFEFEQISKALQQKAHETVLEINLNSVVSNLNFYKSKLKKPDTKIMAMVKASSYGSGSFEIANLLQYHQVDYLAVAYSDEGVELRRAGIKTPMMVMNPDAQGFDAMIKHNLEPEIYSFRILDLLEKSIQRNIIPDNKPVKIHIKLDTGMHRLGFDESELDKLIERLKSNQSIYVQSVFSHLAASDDSNQDTFTNLQISRFRKMSKQIVEHADHLILLHILNSAGINRFPDAQFDMIRLGISMYGIGVNPDDCSFLENVLTLKSSISQIKFIKAKDSIGYNREFIAESDMSIAIVPIGYADGLNRKLSNKKGKLFVNGKFAPIIGNVCMDMCMIDISDIPSKEGDEVIIFGNEYPITEMARVMETIPYEILTGISRRVKRVYFQE
jgi:alanine racemase